MGVKKVLKRGLFSAFNFKNMLGFESLKQQTKAVKGLAKSAYTIDSDEDAEFKPATFQECLKHYGVSEAQLQKRMRTALMTTYFCLALSVGTIGYGIFQLTNHFMSGVLMCGVLTLILWTMAFREHFNWFRMSQRRLTCTVKEWFLSFFKKSK